MYSATISLSSIETVKKFVNIANSYDFQILLHSDKYIINGKSIMGIFSLDLSKPVTLKVEEDCPEKFKNDIKPFIVQSEE